MKATPWAAIALTLALAGCQPGTDQQAGNTQSEQAAGQGSPVTQADLADALIEAARVQASLARDDRTTANAAIRQLRDELAAAKSTAPLDVQTRINALDQVAIETQQAIESESPEASQRAERLLDETQLALAGGEPGQVPTGGGAGRSGELEGETGGVPEPGGMAPAPAVSPGGPPMNAPVQPNQPAEPVAPAQPNQPGGSTVTP